MSREDPSDPYHMAALKKQKVVAPADVLSVGEGTPWEDRGRIGLVGAFLKTCGMSLTSPGKLMNSMRRPEVSSDVRSFVIGCGLMWAICVLIHYVYFYMKLNHAATATPPMLFFYPNQFWLNTLIQAAATCAGTWAILKIASMFYLKIIAHDLPRTPPNSLVFNAMGYAMGPSILALIPGAGAPLGAIWIFVNWITVGSSRLHATKASSAIAAVLTSVAIPLVILAVWYFRR